MTVKRSQININPYNPKVHEEKAVKNQVKNFKKVGYLGGIVWNKTSSNLIDGHRRVFALDYINKYDGTEDTDYDITVDVCELDEKTEKEQMTYMAIGNTKADLQMIANYADEIDVENIGLDDYEVKQIMTYLHAETDVEVPTLDDLIADINEETDINNAYYKELPPPPPTFTPTNEVKRDDKPQLSYEERKQIALEGKKEQKEDKILYSQEKRAYVTLSFERYEEKADFMQFLGYDPTDTIISGEDFLSKLKEQ